MQSGWRGTGIARMFPWVTEATRWTFEVSAVPGGSTGCREAAYKISNWERGATLREAGSETRCRPELPMFPGECKRSKRPHVRLQKETASFWVHLPWSGSSSSPDVLPGAVFLLGWGYKSLSSASPCALPIFRAHDHHINVPWQRGSHQRVPSLLQDPELESMIKDAAMEFGDFG